MLRYGLTQSEACVLLVAPRVRGRCLHARGRPSVAARDVVSLDALDDRLAARQ